MKYVGFPNELPITREEIRNMLYEQGEAVFDQMLVVELKQTGQVIGECKLPQPDENGIIEPDIKLLPAHWGSGYGGEIWMTCLQN
jgi:RimJ/RimL family protein N-acetyltransferase